MNIAPIDRHLLGCLVAAGGEGSLEGLWGQTIDDLLYSVTAARLFAHRAAQRLQQAGLIERDGDRIRLVSGETHGEWRRALHGLIGLCCIVYEPDEPDHLELNPEGIPGSDMDTYRAAAKALGDGGFGS